MITHPLRTNARRARPAKGFSLAELMIAMGILAFGLAMVASLFPAAIKRVESSANDTIGQIICENALAVARTRLRHDPAGNAPTALGDATGSIGAADRQYPAGSGGRFGYVLLGRAVKEPDADGRQDNDYQLVIVSYRKSSPANQVSPRSFPCSPTGFRDINSDGRSELTVGTADQVHLKVGSPLIVAATGEFARILAVDGPRVVMDRVITAPTGSELWTVVETAGGIVLPRSPAWSTFVTRTALTR